MTTPDECLRAICWGDDLLSTIANDMSLPEALNGEARRIASGYPEPEALLLRIRSGQSGLPPEWEKLLRDAYALFIAVRVHGAASPSLRAELVHTLRHFPNETIIRVMSGPASQT